MLVVEAMPPGCIDLTVLCGAADVLPASTTLIVTYSLVHTFNHRCVAEGELTVPCDIASECYPTRIVNRFIVSFSGSHCILGSFSGNHFCTIWCNWVYFCIFGAHAKPSIMYSFVNLFLRNKVRLANHCSFIVISL